MSTRQVLSALCALAIALLSVDWTLARIPFSDRTRLSQFFTEFPDRPWYPEYPRFLEEVRARTSAGDRVVMIVPATSWDDRYSFAYMRASYVLAGREVLPLMTKREAYLPENLASADYLAVWRADAPPVGQVVYQGHDGALIRK